MIRSTLLVIALLALSTSASSLDIDVTFDAEPLDINNSFELSSAHTTLSSHYDQPHYVQSPSDASHINSEPYRRRSMTDIVESAEPTSSSSSSTDKTDSHSMHIMQSSSIFSMERLTARAPWSQRIQPALQYRQNEITYTQHATGIVIRAGENALHMFEGGLTTRYNGTDYIENDVWLSADDGRTWDLIAGRSMFGASAPTIVYASNRNTFTGRRGSNSCADPKSDIVYSIGGGNPVTGNNTNDVWYSTNGIDWIQRYSFERLFTPARHFTSCDIDEMGQLFMIGGHAHNVTSDKDYLLDDIWMTNSLYAYNPWRRVTEHAPFGPREEHLVLIANSTALKSEIIYVISGKVSCHVNSTDCSDGTNANDVWASSDSAKTWTRFPTPPWGRRWGAGGVVAPTSGALIVFGGLNSVTGASSDTTTYRDVWATFDGAITWHSCSINETRWIRGESSAVINSRGQLIVAAGYAYQEDGNQQVRYNDIWRTTFSVDDPVELAARCGGPSVLPKEGTGLRTWPGLVPDKNVISFTPITRRAPWSPRIQPALFLQNQARTYVNPNDGTTASTGPDWLLMYEGSLTSNSQNENDVYASADDGQTWVLISGIALRGLSGYKESASPHTSFESRGAAGNCENPTNDDVYSLAGIRYHANGTSEAVTDVWYSSDSINWVKRPATSKSFSPGRYFSSCDIDNKGSIYLIGGQTLTGEYLNDVWRSRDAGKTWSLVASRKFPGRSEHAVQIVHSERYQTDIIYVMGGYTKLTNGATSVLNDVWVSSDGAAWKSIASTKTRWSPRWGAAAFVTDAGMLGILSGTDATNESPEDFWVSLNGGRDWISCKLPVNGGIVRGEQAIVLTADERLLIGNGYRYQINPSYRTEFSDLWISDMSFKNPRNAELRSACPGLQIPTQIGYIDSSWSRDPDDDDSSSTGDFESSTGSSGSSSSTGLSTTVIIAIVVVVVLVLGVGYYLYRNHAQTGSWNPFDSGNAAQNVRGSVDTTSLFADSDLSATNLQPSQSATQMSNF